MRTMPRCESQPISGLCHLLIRILPIIRPWGFVLLERLPCANPSSSRKHAFPRFHFPGAGSAPGRCGTGSEAARLLHNPKTSVPGTSSDGAGEARRTSYRPGAPGSLPVLQLRYVVRLEFSGSFGPMQRGAEPRCRGAPNGSCITQIIGVQ